MGSPLPTLDARSLVIPLLPALPAAAASTEPALAVLPLLSPILRQRVQLLAASSTEPWLRLLCYDQAKAPRLVDAARGEGLEPHPVSGEVEVDWDYDVQTHYRRVDIETAQALIVMPELSLAFQLVYCVNDPDGSKDGWKVGEITVPDKPDPFVHFGGFTTMTEAERRFADASKGGKQTPSQLAVPETNGQVSTSNATAAPAAEDDDDGYWDRYDATPARTPAEGRSPAPRPTATATASQPNSYRPESAEDDYYAQYDDVQPAMDNHDPDEAAQAAHIIPPLGMDTNSNDNTTTQRPIPIPTNTTNVENRENFGLLHPRPESSASSNGSHTVARLEHTAGKQEQNEFGVKQHVSRSIRSLFMLSKASGIDRDEFESLVKTELDLLGMMDDQE